MGSGGSRSRALGRAACGGHALRVLDREGVDRDRLSPFSVGEGVDEAALTVPLSLDLA